ncbi:MAG TPA: fibronectin type III domain-containing protein [Marinobacter sp.]|nr:fibronectin type III domain-containing protein [Marinobacter sp.]
MSAVLAALLLTGCGEARTGSHGAQSQAVGSPSGGAVVGSELGSQHKATLSWEAPSTRANGEGMRPGELDSYVISYGQDRNNLNRTVEVEDAAQLTGGGTPSYTVTGLRPGTWYFRIQAKDYNGLLSAPSQMVSKTISS